MSINSKYLRISITNKCNLDCYFCHGEGQSKLEMGYELTLDDILFIVETAKHMGFTKLKLTGGEPTLRKDIIQIIEKINKIQIDDFSIISNGVNLLKLAKDLREAGLPRINVTLQTLNKDRFYNTICRDTSKLDLILSGIDKALEVGYTDMKLNFIYHSKESEDDLKEICEFAKTRDLLIVVLPILMINPKDNDYVTGLDTLYKRIQQFDIAQEEIILDNEGIMRKLIKLKNGTSLLIRMNELSEIFPYQHCLYCKKKKSCREGIFPIRITADGFILPCLSEGIMREDIKNSLVKKDKSQLISMIQKYRIV